MKKVVSFNLNNQSEWEFIQNLLNRLSITYETLDSKNNVGQSEDSKVEEALISELYGSWPGDESSDETIQKIYNARVNTSNEIVL
ncbi:hypothetical protein [Haliscomenobacter hydrossis]|jgi:hypothetical protein|uniref:Uncharacterized protein n=1 Tax=Haliscomenobacter hydrossis (strain ATCC 27775 / DSM 1100 / LMG 10767 / O) TaxID=760192 RepID=F4L6M4_HALH1|nr:hypothetical protein [Haliscomenobacter hydrossis]AEE49867.1 hypothetical protein Halhy_1982 [Haliscomenobacter hydrossis DSM 1100]